jgi:ferric-dicitrate binding protein FerR (iron transport regulator)
VVRKGEKLPGPGVEELTSADQSNAALRQVELLFEDNRAIILKGAPLRELVERVGNFTGARLKVAPALEERRLSGQIGTGPVGSLLMLTCLENDLTWSVTEQGTFC